MAAAMRAARGASHVAGGRPMSPAAAFGSGAAVRPAALPLLQQRRRRVVVARAADDDAELEARLAKLKAAKGATTDAEKRAARAARQSGAKAAGPDKPKYDFSNETTYWEGGPATADLVFNLVLGATLVWLPLTFGAIGRNMFLKYRFTDKRLTVYDTFPGRGKQTDIAYQEVSEVRTVSRGLGAWGDMVVVLRNGDKVEILGLEKFGDIKAYILERRDALTGRKADAAKAPSIMDLDADDAAVGLGAGKKAGGGKGFSA